MKSNRIIRLEACRGIAAWSVVATHMAPDGLADKLYGTVFFVAINGSAAVAFFFVLSGYVLSVRFFEKPNPSLIVMAAIKRLPRLALLTTIVTVASAILWRLGLYGAEAQIFWPADFHPSLAGALKAGAWRTFMVGDSMYDSSLWTMVHEFRGSMVVFVLAPFVAASRGLAWLVFLFSAVVFHYADQFMVLFVFGVAIAYYHREIRLPWWATAITFAAGIFLLSFAPTATFLIKDRSVINPYQPTSIVLAWTLGASFLIIAVLQSSIAERLLDNRIGGALGYLSFPVYLVHVPILWTGIPASAAICTILLASWPLAFIDASWVKFLNRAIVQGPIAARMAASGERL